MRLARVTGTVTATLKEAGLTGLKLLVVDVEDGAGAVTATGVVVADVVGAGAGDLVLLAEGSAARLPAACAGQPVDAAAVAIVDQVDMAAPKRAAAKGRK